MQLFNKMVLYGVAFISLCLSEKVEIDVMYNAWGDLFEKVFQVSFLNSHYFFVIWVADPNGEKALKVLGEGFGDETE